MVAKLDVCTTDEAKKIWPHSIEHLLSGGVIRVIDSFVQKRMELAVPEGLLSEALKPVDESKNTEIAAMSTQALRLEISRLVSWAVLTIQLQKCWMTWAGEVPFPSPVDLYTVVSLFIQSHNRHSY